MEVIVKSLDKNSKDFLNKLSRTSKAKIRLKDFVIELFKEKEIIDIIATTEIQLDKNTFSEIILNELVDFNSILVKAFKISWDENLSNIYLSNIFYSLLDNNSFVTEIEKIGFKKEYLINAALLNFKKIYLETLIKVQKKEASLRIIKKVNAGMTGRLSPNADLFTSDLSRNAYKFADTNFVNRTYEYSQVLKNLIENKSTILIGDSGVGKTTIIQKLALDIAMSNVPDKIQDTRLVLLNSGSLISGDKNSDSRDSFRRMSVILDEISNSKYIILVIEEVSNLIGIKDGNSDSSFDLFSLLLNVIENSGLKVIMTSSKENYEKYISKNPSIFRLLREIKIDEMNKEDINEVLISRAVHYEKKYNKIFSLPALNEAHLLSKRFMPNIKLPLGSLNILEETISKSSNRILNKADIHRTIKEKFNIDVSDVKKSDTEDLSQIEDKFHESVIGQNLAITAVSQSLKKARLNIIDSDGPMASFLFLGPTGVGKTELAKKTAEIFFNGNKNFLRLDMSEYPDKNSIYKLIGSNSQTEYIPGLLTEPIKNNPFCLILLDEIEKAYPEVLDVFLQLLDDGRITDGNGKTVDFKNTIIIATSNVGNSFIQESYSANVDDKAIQEKIKNDILPKSFRLEFINRFSKIVIFKPLNKEEISKICYLVLDKIKANMKKKDIDFDYNKNISTYIANNVYNPIYGARNVKNFLNENVNNYIADFLIKNGNDKNQKIVIDETIFGDLIN